MARNGLSRSAPDSRPPFRGSRQRPAVQDAFKSEAATALALGAFRPFSQVFDLTSGLMVQGWVA